MSQWEHERKPGYIAAMVEIRRRALQPEPPPKVAWWKLAALTLRSWAYGR